MATTAAPPRAREQSRARYPDRTGFVERDGLRCFYEVYGSGDPPILFVPTWSIVHSRIWKSQIPWFAAAHRVVTFDALGNGRSDRPPAPRRTPSAASPATSGWSWMRPGWIERCWCRCRSAPSGASSSPRSIPIASPASCSSGPPCRSARRPQPTELLVRGSARHRRGLGEVQRSTSGVATTNGSSGSSSARRSPRRHSTKPIEDAVGWGLETDPETLIATDRAPGLSTSRDARALPAAFDARPS